MAIRLFVINVVNFKYSKVIHTMLRSKEFNNQINIAMLISKLIYYMV